MIFPTVKKSLFIVSCCCFYSFCFKTFYSTLIGKSISLLFFLLFFCSEISRTINLLFFFFLEKMTCNNCCKDNVDTFEKATCQFYSWCSLVTFLLNVVLNIRGLWGQYCFNKKVKNSVNRCSVCQFRIVYLNEEYDICENSFDLNFLSKFHTHLVKNLKCLLLETDSHIACRLVNKKFCYVFKDWFDGKLEQFYLLCCLDIFENRKIDQIENNEFKVVVDLIILKIYFLK